MIQRPLAIDCMLTTRGPTTSRGWSAIGRSAVTLIGCALSAFAQSPIATSIERMVANDAASHLNSPDAVIRGEAALIVAGTGQSTHELRILDLAKDPAIEARQRAILALGFLATPTAITYLESKLTTSDERSSADGVIAAFALGLVPNERIGTSVARTLPLFERGSWKRQHDVLVALLLGMTRQPDRGEGQALRQLLEDDANRSPTVRGLLMQLLLPIDRTLDQEQLRQTIRRGSDDERLAIVNWLASRPTADRLPWLDDLTHIAAHGNEPILRATAMLALTRSQHLPALELAKRSLKSRSPAECGQALTTMLTMGGASTRDALEEHLIAERNPGRITALMQSFLAPPSKRLIDYTLSIATDTKLPLATRAAAAELISRSDKQRAVPVLRDLFRAASDARVLTSLANALRRANDSPTTLSRLLDLPMQLAQHTDRWQALLTAGHGEARRQVLSVLQDPNAAVDDIRAAMKAWRKAMILGPLGTSAPRTLNNCLE